MSYVSHEIIDQIRERADIVAVIQSYIPLKRAGRNFKALCPFHHEKTSSFMVSPDKQIFHCFGCGEGGNVFNFVMKYERLNFREALEIVAGKIGFDIPQDKVKKEDSSLINKLFAVNELAARFYHLALLENSQADLARKYLKERSVTEDSIKEFRLGFSLPGWEDLVLYAKKKGFSEKLLERAGLAFKGKQGKYYDRFRGKLMFPITNNQGKVVGFGSRRLNENEEEPKYVNTPETEIYAKRKILYGLHLAKNDVAKSDEIIITEGYFDVIVPRQAGIKNIVGCLGTSFTQEQARVLKRYTKNVILLFDADSSGQAAALRGLDVLLKEELMVKVACLPPGYDADKLIREKGSEAFIRIVRNSKELFSYKLDLLKAKYPLHLIESKVRITNEILPDIKRIENSVLKSACIRHLAQVIEVSEQALWDELKRVKHTEYAYEEPKEHAFLELKVPPAEKMLLRLILEDITVINEIRENLKVFDFEHPLLKKIISLLYDTDLAESSNLSSWLMDRMEEQAAKQLIAAVSTDDFKIVDRERSLRDCINLLKRKKLEAKLSQLESQIKYVEGVGDEQKKDCLFKEFQRLVREKSRLNNYKVSLKVGDSVG